MKYIEHAKRVYRQRRTKMEQNKNLLREETINFAINLLATVDSIDSAFTYILEIFVLRSYYI